MTEIRDQGTADTETPVPTWRRAFRALARLRAQRLGLRMRILLTFSLGFLALSVFLAAITYSFTKSTLIKQREKAGVEQTYHDAYVALNFLASASANPQASASAAIDVLINLGVARPVLNYHDSWAQNTLSFGQEVVPAALKEKVFANEPSMMVITVKSERVLVVGVPLGAAEGAYFEFFSLTEVDDTLRSVGLSLLFAGFITCLLYTSPSPRDS